MDWANLDVASMGARYGPLKTTNTITGTTTWTQAYTGDTACRPGRIKVLAGNQAQLFKKVESKKEA